MLKITLLLLSVFVLVLQPATAQDSESPLRWIPADFDGYLRVDLGRPNDTLIQLNMAYYVAGVLQPARATGTANRALGSYFPVDVFDAENVSFETTILPVLSGEFIVAYRTLNQDFAVRADDALLILPTDDAFAAAGVLSAVTSAQDFGTQSRYRNATIFTGDQTALAFTPSAILVGPEALLHAAIDADAGESPRLVDEEGYAEISADSADWPVFAYLRGDAPRYALSVLLHGDGSAQPVLNALGSAMQTFNGGPLEAAILSGDIEQMGVRLRSDALAGTMQASVVLATGSESAADTEAQTASGVMNYIPRSAMLVQQGGDARAAFYDALVGIPASGYLGDLLSSGLRVPTTAAAAAATPVPTRIPPDAEAIDTAVSGFLTVLSSLDTVDLESDITAHLAGDYAVALLPRPNNPAAGTGALFDVLLVAESADADAAAAGVITLAQTVLALDEAAFTDAAGESNLRTLPGPTADDPVLQVGAVDGKLVVGTGSAVEAALRAGQGDNQLVDVTRWQNISRNADPSLYLDINALLATFQPTVGGPVDTGIGQLGASVHSLGGGFYRLDVMVTLPSAF